MIRRALPVLLAGLLACAGQAFADPAQIQVGALRTPVSRSGAAMREQPKMSATPLGNVPHGTRLMIEAVEGKWVRVTAKVTDGTSKTGWLRAGETVEPYALTGDGRIGTGQGPVPQSTEVSAAARGFGPNIEEQMALGDAQIKAALHLLTVRVEQVKPTPEEVAAFAKQGRLGIPGKVR